MADTVFMPKADWQAALDATRAKGGTTAPMTSAELAPAIEAIPAGGGTQSDWSVNDPNDPAYVKNRFGGYSAVQDLLEEKEYPFIDYDGIYASILPQFIDIVAGATYTVRFGETVVDTVAKSLDGQPYIGNASILGVPGDTGEDFLIVSAPGQGTQIVAKIPSTSIIVGIKGLTDVQIPSRYMKEKPGRVVGEGELFNLAKEASGTGSHAEGCNTIASGDYSHAEGSNYLGEGKFIVDWVHDGFTIEGSLASGINSHAEGTQTHAKGKSSHAQGRRAYAYGINSHAEGDDATAYGLDSHAEGSGTTASGEYQHTQGKYNIPDTDTKLPDGTPQNKYAHIVGNGVGYGDKPYSNAHTLDWEGNSWYQGRVLVGGVDMDAPDAELTPTSVIIKSSTPDSVKRFAITVDDTGTLKATEVV